MKKKTELAFLALIFLLSTLTSIYHYDAIARADAISQNVLISRTLRERAVLPYLIHPFHLHLASNFLLYPFYLIGENLFTFRLSQALFLAAGVVLTYLSAKKLFNQKIGAVSALILTTFPFYILEKINEIPYLPFFLMSYFYLHLKIKGSCGSSRTKFVGAFAFIAGLGVYYKLQMIYFLLGLLIFRWIIEERPLPLCRPTNINFKRVLVALALFLVGLSPLLAYNIQSNFKPVRHLAGNLHKTSAGHNNFAILSNLRTRLKQLNAALTGVDGEYNPPFKAWWNTFFFAAVALIALIKGERKTKGLLGFLAAYTVMITFVPYDQNVHHFHAVIPLLAILASASLARFKRKKISTVAVICFVTINSAFIISTINLSGHGQDWLCFQAEMSLKGNTAIYQASYKEQNNCLSQAVYYMSGAKEVKDLTKISSTQLKKSISEGEVGYIVEAEKSDLSETISSKKESILDHNLNRKVFEGKEYIYIVWDGE